MVFVAVLLPNLLLVVVLALARYEEFMLGGHDPVGEPRERHLAAVPDLPATGAAPGEATSAEAASVDGARTPYEKPVARRRHAA
uniref:Uncharacterized protein n=1 Tax=Streptomyces sp. NBC_00003 TaxID=2903608 RepID=A0AAU2UX67_9ACTN